MKKPKSNLLVPKFLEKHPEFSISENLCKLVNILFYDSFSEIEEKCNKHIIDIIIIEDKIYEEWTSNGMKDLKPGIVIIDSGNIKIPKSKIDKILGFIPAKNLSRQLLNHTLTKSLSNFEVFKENDFLKSKIFKQEKSFSELHDIGVSLSKEKDINKLLEKIISKSMQLTYADGGSLYLIEPIPNSKEIEDNFWANKQIRLKVKKNNSRKMDLDSDNVLDLNFESICGNVILNGKSILIENVYDLPEEIDYHWYGKTIDEALNYHTKSILTVPIFNNINQAIGAIQLVNRKKHFKKILGDIESIQKEVVPFEKRDLYFVESIASQASVAIMNARLIESVHILFDGFINASVKAIESRDPTTSGHSSRVATLTIAFAEIVHQIKNGPFSSVSFNQDQLDEIKYASLLHDFGKIGVRERVLVKSKKLHPEELEALMDRMRFIKILLELETSKKQISYFLKESREKALNNFKSSKVVLNEKLEELDDFLNFVVQANEPTILTQEGFEKLDNLAHRTFQYPIGTSNNYLNKNEMLSLSVQKGSLNEKDRKEIESHVTHTYNFLKIIPWSSNLKRVPEIAHAHHEKLNGKGYPQKLKGNEIPLESKMMTISDIFDALTAWDRPYRKAISCERALDILCFEAKDNHLDKDLLDIFIKAKLYNLLDRTK